MSATEENKAAREAESRTVARDAAEDYRAAVESVLRALATLADEAQRLDARMGPDKIRRREVRAQTFALVKTGRNLGIDVTKMSDVVGVSRQTIHDWINKEEQS